MKNRCSLWQIKRGWIFFPKFHEFPTEQYLGVFPTFHDRRGTGCSEAMLQPNGLVGIWDTAMAAMGAPCEVPGQGPIARCYFSSGASLLWGRWVWVETVGLDICIQYIYIYVCIYIYIYVYTVYMHMQFSLNSTFLMNDLLWVILQRYQSRLTPAKV